MKKILAAIIVAGILLSSGVSAQAQESSDEILTRETIASLAKAMVELKTVTESFAKMFKEEFEKAEREQQFKKMQENQ